MRFARIIGPPTALISEAISEPHCPSKEPTCLKPAFVAVNRKFLDRLGPPRSPNADIVTDDEEFTYDTCTSIERGHAIFDEKLQEETTGSIEILKENN
ncbi:hypothetical protein AVEN_156840-1 [Araneus ventricosus]|uniref:Uncharacterized protein n=1 Tax=Araneus ventricosus TaxID=182803 RepID=A0A4Y2V1V9_ARAVE|nr:hypothetical protein AVEN_40940-1 [Araneus ventricosus]GBO19195.1 hypothetical protein AVEN_156840-1 [Araneus ventricosus]